jgi:hypothetical protein
MRIYSKTAKRKTLNAERQFPTRQQPLQLNLYEGAEAGAENRKHACRYISRTQSRLANLYLLFSLGLIAF